MKVRSRFSYFRDKLQVFSLGFLFGIVLGGGFFVLKLDQYVKELSFYKSLTQHEDRNDIANPENKSDVALPKTKRVKKNNATVVSDSTTVNYSGDSTLPVVFNNESQEDGMVIRKDEMLGQRSFSIHALHEVNSSDSVSKTEPVVIGTLAVEFWKSPLNYRGYKFSRNKAILFGFESADVESFYSSDNMTYMRTPGGIYRLDVSSDFHSFERITDESLISRMK